MGAGMLINRLNGLLVLTAIVTTDLHQSLACANNHPSYAYLWI